MSNHPYTRRSIRSNSQSSDDTLVSCESLRTLDGNEPPSYSRCMRSRISHLPSAPSSSSLTAKHLAFDESLLEELDDLLLADPFESFADDCYAHAVWPLAVDAPHAYAAHTHRKPRRWIKVVEEEAEAGAEGEMDDFIQMVDDMHFARPQTRTSSVSRTSRHKPVYMHTHTHAPEPLHRSQSTNSTSKRVQFVRLSIPFRSPRSRILLIICCTAGRNAPLYVFSTVSRAVIRCVGFQTRFGRGDGGGGLYICLCVPNSSAS